MAAEDVGEEVQRSEGLELNVRTSVIPTSQHSASEHQQSVGRDFGVEFDTRLHAHENGEGVRSQHSSAALALPHVLVGERLKNISNRFAGRHDESEERNSVTETINTLQCDDKASLLLIVPSGHSGSLKQFALHAHASIVAKKFPVEIGEKIGGGGGSRGGRGHF